jgi:hypothetical protein
VNIWAKFITSFFESVGIMKILVKYVVVFPCLGCEHADVPEEGLPPVHRQLQGKTYFRVLMVRSAVSIQNYFIAII